MLQDLKRRIADLKKVSCDHADVYEVTPEFAAWVLDAVNRGNRHQMRTNVAKYAAMMLAGEWSINPHAVLFCSSDGELIDGQHRMAAVVAAQIPVAMRLEFGRRELKMRVDTGAMRKPIEIAKFYDADLPNDTRVGLALAVIEGGTMGVWGRLTGSEISNLWRAHKGVLGHALYLFRIKEKRISGAVIVGAIARASYTVADSEIETFVQGLYGRPTDDPSIAYLNGAQCSKYVVNTPSGCRGRIEDYNYVQVYLRATVEGRVLQKPGRFPGHDLFKVA